MANAQLFPLDFAPGIQRDGTRVDSKRYLDALWARWRLGRPRKMLGYKEIFTSLQGIPRRMHLYYDGANVYIHVGTSQSFEQVVVDAMGNFVSHSDRTPRGFPGGPTVGWTIDELFDTLSDNVVIVAHAAPDQEHLADATKHLPFYGIITETVPLGTIPPPNVADYQQGNFTSPAVSGGIMTAQPYLLAFDSKGGVLWSAPNEIQTLGLAGGSSGAGRARVSGQKLIYGAALRGGGVNSPAFLLWSMAEVITGTFVGFSNGTFAFNTVSESSSILSSDAVIEYDGIYYWAAADRFLSFNGTVVEVPNQQNQDWFFDNINRKYAGRSYAMKFPRWGEIWFCAPLFGATEPSHAVILNVRENCWYDTLLPDQGRSSGYFVQGFQYPIMGGSTNGGDGYSLWLHEFGLDRVTADGPSPIRSYFDTPFMGGTKLEPPTNKTFSYGKVEADHIQSGPMSVTVIGGFNPMSAEAAEPSSTLSVSPANPVDQMPGFSTAKRLGRLRFESNTLGGNYITGKSFLHYDQTDGYALGPVGKPLTEQP